MALVSDTAKPETAAGEQSGFGALRKLTPLVGIVAFLLAWQLFVIIWKVPPYLLPTPTAIAQTFFQELPDLLHHGWVTVYEMLAGYALAVAVAGTLAASAISDIPLTHMLVAFAPGGLEAMTIMAFALNLDTAYVGSMQIVRYIGISLLLPLAAKWLDRHWRET